VKPGLAYTYHVTAAYPDDGFGPAEVSFTPPAPAVPAWVRMETQGGQSVLLWAPVPDAGSYQIIQTWLVPVFQSVCTYLTRPDGTIYCSVQQVQSGWQPMNAYYVVTAPQSSLLFSTHPAGRFQVGAAYPPSGITAPREQWPWAP
jgi:hypothetical protein